jgi:hypothetical protein
MATVFRSRWRSMRQAMALSAIAVLFLAGLGLEVAWFLGAFESRVTYWSKHGQNCGSVIYGPNGALVDRSGAEHAVACFVAAYARCKAAVLTRNVGGIDTSETDKFVVEPRDSGRGCDVGLHYEFILVSGNHTTTIEAQCAHVTSDNGTLMIGGCPGFDDITMPSPRPIGLDRSGVAS